MITLGLLLGCAGGGDEAIAPEDASRPSPEFWKHWGDGKAEISAYRLTQERYGELRRGEAVLITVTEDFTRAARVKSDGGHADEFPVLKLNEVRDWTTGIYDYNVMTSTFLPLDGSLVRGQPTKISFSSQEWCGHVWEQMRINKSVAGVSRHSYFDGEADRNESVTIPEYGLFADAMPLLVRGLVGDLMPAGSEHRVPWLRSALDRRLDHLSTLWTPATLKRSAEAIEVEVPAGSFTVEVWTLAVADEQTTWWVEVAAPKRLIGWERNDGERAVLTGSIRTPYWRQNREADEGLRAGLGLADRRPASDGDEPDSGNVD